MGLPGDAWRATFRHWVRRDHKAGAFGLIGPPSLPSRDRSSRRPRPFGSMRSVRAAA